MSLIANHTKYVQKEINKILREINKIMVAI